jgi:hypothetical protein
MTATKAWRHAIAVICAASVGSALAADVNFVASPVPAAEAKTSEALDHKGYRVDGARHIYESYPHRIYKGKLPPLVHAIVVVETVLEPTAGRCRSTCFARRHMPRTSLQRCAR